MRTKLLMMFALLLMAVVSQPSLAQSKKMPRTNTPDKRGEMTLTQEASPVQHAVKIKKTVNSDIPEGYARVTLTTHDIWQGYDYTGYQMLLDQDGNTYGRIIPKKGNLTESGNASAEVYAEFEYKIPEGAHGNLNDLVEGESKLTNGSITILIPVGVYDWCITNPTPSQNFFRIYIASEYGNIGGRAEHYLFSGGLEYKFDITLGDNGYDQTNVEIRGLDLSYNLADNSITYNSADVNWNVEGPLSLYSTILRFRKVNERLEYESAAAFEGLEKWDRDGDGHNWQYEETGDAHSGKGVWASYSFDEGRYEPFNPDNWLLMPAMDLRGKALSFCARSKNKEYKDNFGVFFLPDGAEKLPANLVQLGVYTEISTEWTAYTIDVSSLGVGQVVFRHFDSADRWALYIDDVTIFDQNAVDHPEQYNWVNMSHVMDHPHHIFGLESGTKYEMQMRVEPAGWGESVFFTTADPLVLEDNADNSTVLSANPDYTGYVKLNGRTLYKDGSWNTLCLPFDLTLSGSVLDGDDVELMTLSSSGFDDETGTLFIDFEDVEYIEDNEPYIKAGKPYIIKWNNTGNHIVNPVFDNVTIENESPANQRVTSLDGKVTFSGTYNSTTFTEDNKSILFLGGGNKLYYPQAGASIGAFRAFFTLDLNAVQDVKTFVLNFGDETETGIRPTPDPSTVREGSAGAWYTVDGRKVNTPSLGEGRGGLSPGIYIHNGRKIVIK